MTDFVQVTRTRMSNWTTELACGDCGETVRAQERMELPWGKGVVISWAAGCDCGAFVVGFEGPEAGCRYYLGLWSKEIERGGVA